MRLLGTFAFLLACLVKGRPVWSPSPKTIARRLAQLPQNGLPLDRPVVVRWNAYQVPYIEAWTDRDLAFALGLTHAHLRLAQIRLLKQLSQGRLSEMFGPMAHDLDHFLRILDLGRAAPEIERKMAPETRAMLEAFAMGLNFHQSRPDRLPPEFALLGLVPEPFTVRDLIGISRLAGADVNWLAAMSLLPLRTRPDWPEIWSRALAAGTGQSASFQADIRGLNDLLAATRPGSNAVAVSAARSASGAALLAGDPHLGIGLPNFWLLAGMRSPSYQGVGLMIPGLPFLMLGRTPHIAWTGTNMRAAVSDLCDLTRLIRRGDCPIETRTTTIRTRFGRGVTLPVRQSPLGPIVSDARRFPAAPGETLALRWVGHLATDEFGAMDRVMRARDVAEFRQALSGFAVPSQNMLCADTRGNICQVLATRLPKRSCDSPPGLVLDAADPGSDWPGLADALELPYSENPEEGFLASANNRPASSPWPMGWFFSPDERVRRLRQVLEVLGRITPDDLMDLQQDTVSLDARDLAARLVGLIAADPEAGQEAPGFLAELSDFGGDYQADAKGPVCFETLLHHLAAALYGNAPGPYGRLEQLALHLVQDLEAAPAGRRREILVTAVGKAAVDSAGFPTWGHMHRLRLGHWFGRIPLAGRLFPRADLPVGGSRETVMKTAHGLTNGLSEAVYGSQARFVADMGDPDASWFVLLGGNDGWPGSENALDQLPHWRSGRMIGMPLRPEAVAREFPLVTNLTPDGGLIRP
jgi:penicillin amidase